jgi:hypothetical protein
MDSEAPASPLRRIATRAAATLLALLVLYALSSGPIQAYRTYSFFQASISGGSWPGPNHLSWLKKIYGPLESTISGTPLKAPYDAYLEWWLNLAYQQLENQIQRLPQQP